MKTIKVTRDGRPATPEEIKCAVEGKPLPPPLEADFQGRTIECGQCECCASPVGERIWVGGTTRIICNQCCGFIARWWIEIEEKQPAKPNPTRRDD